MKPLEKVLKTGVMAKSRNSISGQVFANRISAEK